MGRAQLKVDVITIYNIYPWTYKERVATIELQAYRDAEKYASELA